jgi:hypothetical protein
MVPSVATEKFPSVTQPGIDSETFRTVAQCLNHYATPGPLTYLFTYLLTYLLTPWSRVLLENLTGFAASQKIPRIYGTRKFITVLTSARHMSLS